MSTLNLRSVRTNIENKYGKFKIFTPWANVEHRYYIEFYPLEVVVEAKSFDDAKHKAQNQLHTFTNEDLLCLSAKAISAMDEDKTTHEYC
jgi:hypothetical protein